MSTYSIYFSPTQGTKKVTNALASAFEGYREIELCKADDGSTLPVFTWSRTCVLLELLLLGEECRRLRLNGSKSWKAIKQGRY